MVKLNPPRWLAPLLIVALIAGVVIGNRVLRPTDQPEQTLNCADLRAGCSTRLGNQFANRLANRGADQTVTIGVDGALKALQPFDIWLKTPISHQPDKVSASFTMEGMDMGFNLYTLRRGADGVYRARVTLPVCVSGQPNWILNLDIDGQRLRIPFVTSL